MSITKGYAKSKLPGGLASEAEAVAGVNEDFLFEFVAHQGCGISLTESRLIITQAGMLKTGALKSRRSAFIALHQIQLVDLLCEPVDDEKRFFLQIVSAGALTPSWANKVLIKYESVPEAFRLAQALLQMVDQLRENMGALPSASIVCPHCEQPYSGAAEKK